MSLRVDVEIEGVTRGLEALGGAGGRSVDDLARELYGTYCRSSADAEAAYRRLGALLLAIRRQRGEVVLTQFVRAVEIHRTAAWRAMKVCERLCDDTGAIDPRKEAAVKREIAAARERKRLAAMSNTEHDPETGAPMGAPVYGNDSDDEGDWEDDSVQIPILRAPMGAPLYGSSSDDDADDTVHHPETGAPMGAPKFGEGLGGFGVVPGAGAAPGAMTVRRMQILARVRGGTERDIAAILGDDVPVQVVPVRGRRADMEGQMVMEFGAIGERLERIRHDVGLAASPAAGLGNAERAEIARAVAECERKVRAVLGRRDEGRTVVGEMSSTMS